MLPIVPVRAPVRPCAYSLVSGEKVPLESLVAEVREDYGWGFVQIVGTYGVGKSVALQHLAAVLSGAEAIEFHDDALFQTDEAWDRLIVFARTDPIGHSDIPALRATFQLAPWDADQWIEYLLAVHPAACASVMRRVRAEAGQVARLNGSPELWRIVLDILARDESVRTTGEALDVALATHLERSAHKTDLMACCAALVALGRPSSPESPEVMREPHPPELLRLLSHRVCQVMLGAAALVLALRERKPPALLERHLPIDLIREAAPALDEAACRVLQTVLDSKDGFKHAMAASLLFAKDPNWAPPCPELNLTHGYFAKARWSGAKLGITFLQEADLRSADLAGADLESARLARADLSTAKLVGATLRKADLSESELSGADLSQCDASNAFFTGARLTGALLTHGVLREARLADCDLTDAGFARADLSEALLARSNLTRTDFGHAVCVGTNFSQCSLATADLSGATFCRAKFDHTFLEELDLSGLDFSRASFRDALLTDSKAHGTCFREASFRAAGLAGIDWEGADLRGADLRGVSFHLGSTRCGLVGSPLASEGTRTGFYTEDYIDQEIQEPEQIRKANLCGADLRGANIDDVDFYLVDLRGARYTTQQEVQLRRTGAILDHRAPA
jgi:uncharacterized protein YjbI with pentapeptide repeats